MTTVTISPDFRVVIPTGVRDACEYAQAGTNYGVER